MAAEATEATESLPKEAGLVGLELATSGVTGDPAVKLAKNHASFYA